MSRSLDFVGKEPESGPSLAIHPVQQNGDLPPDEPIHLMASKFDSKDGTGRVCFVGHKDELAVVTSSSVSSIYCLPAGT